MHAALHLFFASHALRRLDEHQAQGRADRPARLLRRRAGTNASRGSGSARPDDAKRRHGPDRRRSGQRGERDLGRDRRCRDPLERDVPGDERRPWQRAVRPGQRPEDRERAARRERRPALRSRAHLRRRGDRPGRRDDSGLPDRNHLDTGVQWLRHREHDRAHDPAVREGRRAVLRRDRAEHLLQRWGEHGNGTRLQLDVRRWIDRHGRDPDALLRERRLLPGEPHRSCHQRRDLDQQRAGHDRSERRPGRRTNGRGRERHPDKRQRAVR